MLPIQYPKVYEMYKKHVASFWTAEAGDISSPGSLIRSSIVMDVMIQKKQRFRLLICLNYITC